MEIQFKNNSLAIKDVDTKEGIVSGYFASFDSEPDSDGDIIQPGAFSKTITENGPRGKGRIRHLLDHDYTKGVALIQELYEDSKGLYYTSKAGRHTLGRDFVLMVDDGIIKEHSIGYRIIKEAKNNETGINTLTELRLWEGSSLQGWGANMNTPIMGLKSAEDIIDFMDSIYRGLKNGKYSDETMLKLQEKHNLLSEYFKNTKPDNATLSNEGNEEPEGVKAELIIQTFKNALQNGSRI